MTSSAITLSDKDIQEIAFIMITLLRDPELVMYFLKIYIPIERDHLFKLSRDFHQSLRLKPSDRWRRLNELCEKREFSKISARSSIPIDCTIPIDGVMWRVQKEIMTSIKYMRGYFIRCDTHNCYSLNEDTTTHLQKVRLINHLGEGWGLCNNIRKAYEEYLEYEEDLENDQLPEYYFYNECPHLIYNSQSIRGSVEILN